MILSVEYAGHAFHGRYNLDRVSDDAQSISMGTFSQWANAIGNAES